VGENEEMSIKQVADAVVRSMEFKGDYTVRDILLFYVLLLNFHHEKFDTTQADGQYRKPASNKKLLSLIGEFSFTPFDEGSSCIINCLAILTIH
jgi:GDP-L-fucose synthase